MFHQRFPAATIVLAVFLTAGCAMKKAGPPQAAGTAPQVTATLELLKATHANDQPFLDNHGILRDNLASLENITNALSQAPDIERIRMMYRAQLNQAIDRADVIAKRPTESIDDKQHAAEIRDKLLAIRKG